MFTYFIKFNFYIEDVYVEDDAYIEITIFACYKT